MQPTFNETAAKNNSVCPFLGVSDDPGTALSYPSVSNYCHHAMPIEPVRRTHQANFCLGGTYEKCRVFKTEGKQPLPPEIRESGYRTSRRIPRFLLLSSLVVILVFAFFIIDSRGSNLLNSHQNEEDLNFQALQTITQIAQSTQTGIARTSAPSSTPEPSPTPTELPATPSPTSFPPHQLEIPFGFNPRFVIHKVLAGESYMRFMQDYNTTREAIVAVNYGSDSFLWEDSILIIPIDVTDATGLPSFTAYQVNEPNITVEKLAIDQGADLSLLVRYNDLPAGYLFSVGEWVLIPH
jgi:hypothetical protein